MGDNYLTVLFLLAFAVFLGGAFIIISSLLGRPGRSSTNLEPYECGIDQARPPVRPLNIKFFMIAMAFMLFDVEVALLYPWAALFREFALEGAGGFILIEGLMFIAVLSVGLVFIYRTGALNGDE